MRGQTGSVKPAESGRAAGSRPSPEPRSTKLPKRPRTAQEVRLLYDRGRRDFRGFDLRQFELRGIDLSGLDLRGADLSEAILENARLHHIQCGALLRWRCVRWVLQLLIGVIAGLLQTSAAFSGAAVAAKEVTELGPRLRYLPGAVCSIVFCAIVLLILRQGVKLRRTLLLALAACLIVPLGGLFRLDSTTVGMLSGSVSASVIEFALACIAAPIGGVFWSVSVSALCNILFISVAADETTWSAVCVACTSLISLIAMYYFARRTLAGDLRYVRQHALRVAVLALFGTRFRGCDLIGASFEGAELTGADFTGAALEGCRFRGAHNLELARCGPGRLSQLPVRRLLSSGVGEGGGFAQLNLRDLVIEYAALRGADLTRADLRGAYLKGTDLLAAKTLEGVQVDTDTFNRSGWKSSVLETLQDRGVRVEANRASPLQDAVQDLRAGETTSLLMYFDRAPGQLDQLLLQAAFIESLGSDHSARIVSPTGDPSPDPHLCVQAAKREELLSLAEWLAGEPQRSSEAQAPRTPELAALLNPLLRHYKATTAASLQRIELHEPLTSSSENEARATRRSLTWDVLRRRVEPDRPRCVAILATAEDAVHELALRRQLASLAEQGLIEPLSVDSTASGMPRQKAARATLARADLVLCLLSPELLSAVASLRTGATSAEPSGELAEGLRLAQFRKVALPILLRPVDRAQTSLLEAASLPRGGRPLSECADYAGALRDVAVDVRRWLLGLREADSARAAVRSRSPEVYSP